MSKSIDQLREEIKASLKNSGTLQRIKAEIRAELYQEQLKLNIEKNETDDSQEKKEQGQYSPRMPIMYEQIKDFQKKNGMKSTQSVFKEEYGDNQDVKMETASYLQALCPTFQQYKSSETTSSLLEQFLIGLEQEVFGTDIVTLMNSSKEELNQSNETL